MNQLYRICTLLFTALALVPFWMRGQLTIVLNSLPSNTPMNDPLYVAGSFNQWQANDPKAKLERNTAGKYQIVLFPAVGPVHFTFTRGSWAAAEGNSTAEYSVLHAVHYDGQPKTVYVSLLSWRNAQQTAFNGDKRGTVAVLDDSLYIPQLNRTRRIFLYLPPGYYTTPQKKYPVLYLQEGQTLFQGNAFQNEEWSVDEAVDEWTLEGNYGCIVVGIEGGGQHLMNEYSPWLNTVYGVGGQGAAYANFIVSTLKPFIDQVLRTNPAREYTGIGGAGFGALISLYAATEYQHIFSKVLLFSPAFWFCDVALQNHVLGKGKRNPMRMYFLVGGQEPFYVLQSMQNIVNVLRHVGFENGEIAVDVPAEGRGVIAFWHKKYPVAHEWLFEGLTTSTVGSAVSVGYSLCVYPNPAVEWIRVRSAHSEWQQVQIIGLDGALRREVWVYGEEAIAVYDLPRGAYVVRVRAERSTSWRTASWFKL